MGRAKLLIVDVSPLLFRPFFIALFRHLYYTGRKGEGREGGRRGRGRGRARREEGGRERGVKCRVSKSAAAK